MIENFTWVIVLAFAGGICWLGFYPNVAAYVVLSIFEFGICCISAVLDWVLTLLALPIAFICSFLSVIFKVEENHEE